MFVEMITFIFPVDRLLTAPAPDSSHITIVITESDLLLKCSTSTITTSLCPRPVETRRPAPARPTVKVQKIVLELPELPPPPPPPPAPLPERVRPNLPEVPKLKIKFSTCTALYSPAKPSYERFRGNSRETESARPRTTTSRPEYDRREKSYRRNVQ